MPFNQQYVILVHGFFRTSRSMRKIEKALKFQGYKVINKTYPLRKYSIPFLSERYLKKIVNHIPLSPNTKIHFVGYSLGGIIIRYFLWKNKVKNLGRVVFIASPNKGSKMVDFFNKFSISDRLLGPSFSELGTSPTKLPKKIPNPYYDLGIIAGKYDGEVPIKNTKLEPVQDFVVVPHTHFFIIHGKKVVQHIIHFLAQGSFHS